MKKFYLLSFFCLLVFWLFSVNIVKAADVCGGCPTDSTCDPGSKNCTINSCDIELKPCERSNCVGGYCDISSYLANQKKEIGADCTFGAGTNDEGGCAEDQECSPEGKCVANSGASSGATGGTAAAGGAGSSDIAGLNVSGIDPRCWTGTDCAAKRIELGIPDADATNSLYRGSDTEEACGGKINADGEQIGFCNPIGKVTTAVSFGGRKDFDNWGDFTNYMFKYIIIIAGVLAVLMIIVAGVEWTTSGGSPDRIGSAKKRIGGAISGLILAVLSYTILYNINPYLVNLRPPQAWLINPQAFVPALCNTLDKRVIVAKAYTEESTPPSKEGLIALFAKVVDGSYKTNTQDAKCGDYYFVKDGAGKVCKGTACGNHKVCLYDMAGAKCVPGQLVIHFYVNTSLAERAKIATPIAWVQALRLPNWLDMCDSDGPCSTAQSVFYGVCRNDSTGQVVLGSKQGYGEDWGNESAEGLSVKITDKGKNDYQEYLVTYNGFDTAHPIDHWGCDEATGFKLAGFLLKTELSYPEMENTAYDGNLNVGYDSGFATYGLFGLEVKFENYFPYSDLVDKGIYVNVELSDTELDEIHKNKGTSPVSPLAS